MRPPAGATQHRGDVAPAVGLFLVHPAVAVERGDEGRDGGGDTGQRCRHNETIVALASNGVAFLPDMDRRVFIGSLAVVTAVARAAFAQPARKVFRIGILAQAATSDLVGPQPRSPSVGAFLRGLRELGYVYGEHFVIEPRGAEGKPARASPASPPSCSVSRWT
jgi:hypothetical protein